MSVLKASITSVFIASKILTHSIAGFDSETIRLCDELIAGAKNLNRLLSTDRDTDEIEGYKITSGEQARLINRISQATTSTVSGLNAKAGCALLKPVEGGYDGGVIIGLSVCKALVLLRSKCSI